MKKSMKKFMVACAAVSAMTVVAGMSAMAATYDEATNVATYTVPTAAEGTQMTVLVIPTSAKNNVQDSDILYINQDAVNGEGVDGTAELKGTKLDDGDYVAMVGYTDPESNQFTIKEDAFHVGEVNTGVEVLVGDADQNARVTTNDAAVVLKHTTKSELLTGAAFQAAAYADNNNRITTNDAAEILKYASKLQTEYVGNKITVTVE